MPRAKSGKPRNSFHVTVDRLIHEPVRLAIMSALEDGGTLTFSDLKVRLDATDGNLGVHARRLEAAGYVACAKSFDGRVPQTRYRLTARGRRAFGTYRTHLRMLVGSLG